MKAFAKFLFENSPWEPSWTALIVGYAVLGFDGRMYLTADGEAYLEVTDVAA